MILVTGASGHLGRLVIDNLIKRGTPAEQIIAAVRSPKKAQDLAAQGVSVRKADYDNIDTLNAAMTDVKRVVLVSSSEVGQRTAQHKNIIQAAKDAAVELLAYTSILDADHSPLQLAAEHVETEQLLTASGVPYVLLRNGWYSENYTENIDAALEHGAVLGCAGQGKYATATRANYAEAAAVVITRENQAGKVYELAGDHAFTLEEYAQALSKISGKPVVYQDLSEAEYVKILVDAGVPEGFATILADADTGAAKGGLFDDSHSLSALIGHPTTPIADSIQAAL